MKLDVLVYNNIRIKESPSKHHKVSNKTEELRKHKRTQARNSSVIYIPPTANMIYDTCGKNSKYLYLFSKISLLLCEF